MAHTSFMWGSNFKDLVRYQFYCMDRHTRVHVRPTCFFLFSNPPILFAETFFLKIHLIHKGISANYASALVKIFCVKCLAIIINRKNDCHTLTSKTCSPIQKACFALPKKEKPALFNNRMWIDLNQNKKIKRMWIDLNQIYFDHNLCVCLERSKLLEL